VQYFIEPLFQIEFFKIKSCFWQRKKKLLNKVLQKHPESLILDFYSNRDKADFIKEFLQIFKEEFQLISTKYNSKIKLDRIWSVTYKKNQFHVPHNHGSTGYAAILYVDMDKTSPVTTYIRPWNNTETDTTVFTDPPVEEGDLVIVPQFLMHFTNPNKTSFKKRIVSFDFHLI
tara:strand:+ start:5323 stop:5841 length:519 start_codon:yes stop_codon:yes gene_type:complete